MKKSGFVTVFCAVVCVWLMSSCGYKSQVTPIEGSNGYSTYTAKVDGKVLMGVQDAAGVSVCEPRYVDIKYQEGYFSALYPSYEQYDLFDTTGKQVMPEVKKRYCFVQENALADSLTYYSFTSYDEKTYYLFVNMGNRIVGPKSEMSLYPREHVIVYTEGGKFGALSYDNKELVPLSSELSFATREDVKRVRKNGHTVRDTVKTPVIYAHDGKDWQKYSAVTGENLGKLDNRDVELINASDETMLDHVYAVRK